MKVDEVKDALRKRQDQMCEKWFAIRAAKLSQRARLVLTFLLADCLSTFAGDIEKSPANILLKNL